MKPDNLISLHVIFTINFKHFTKSSSKRISFFIKRITLEIDKKICIQGVSVYSMHENKGKKKMHYKDRSI